MKKWTPSLFKAAKGKCKLACVTAYDFTFARLADEAEIPFILVGDSLGMTMLGYDSTLPVTMDDMLRHTAAVARGASKNSIVVGDMPFMSYQASFDDGMKNAGRFLKEAGADAIKLEGFYPELVEALVKAGIPVVAHLGMTPQSVNVFGGFKVQAKTAEAAQLLLSQAKTLSDAGAFAVTLECVPPDVAALVTENISASTIGIGAGAACDAQILVMQDLLGMTASVPKFVKRYGEIGAEVVSAFKEFATEVETGAFPSAEQSYKEAGI